MDDGEGFRFWYRWAVGTVVGLFGVIIGWFIKDNRDSVRILSKEIDGLRERFHKLGNQLSGDYMRREEVEKKDKETELRVTTRIEHLENSMKEGFRDLKNEMRQMFEDFTRRTH